MKVLKYGWLFILRIKNLHILDNNHWFVLCSTLTGISGYLGQFKRCHQNDRVGVLLLFNMDFRVILSLTLTIMYQDKSTTAIISTVFMFISKLIKQPCVPFNWGKRYEGKELGMFLALILF